jgi:nitrate reductase gamma subunit
METLATHAPREIKAEAPLPKRRGTALARAIGLLAAGIVIVGIYAGSRGLRDFDTALVSYAAATVFAAFGVGYRYAIWLSRPPTMRYFRRGLELFFTPRRLPGNLARLARLLWDNIVSQRFIQKRSWLRWASHAGMSWGCILAAAVTFPLSFGWIRFETPLHSQEIYDAYVFGVRVLQFPINSFIGELVFNVLVVSAALVIVGVMLALWRRARDRGDLAVQQVGDDLLPLLLLFAISSTGVLLAVSTRFMHGFHYSFLSQIHAGTVIITLLYLPFGKFFHIFQRPTQITLDFYRRAGAEGSAARCTSCDEPFASALHVADLKQVEAELGIRYSLGKDRHYQDVCPPCRRKNLAMIQDTLWQAARRREGGRS